MMLRDVSEGCGREDGLGRVVRVAAVGESGGILMEGVLGLRGWTGRECVWYHSRTARRGDGG